MRTSLVAVLLAAVVVAAPAQTLSHSGFAELTSYVYPQLTQQDKAHVVADMRVHLEGGWRPSHNWRFAGAFETRTDTHQQTERALRLDWLDRGLQRPAFTVQRLTVTYSHGPVTVGAGKQIIRWGKVDVVHPVDRFAPTDYINVADQEVLPVTAVRLSYERNANSLELIWVPLITPDRAPLLNQRWAPSQLLSLAVASLSQRFPGGSQFGIHWNHVGKTIEHGFYFYQGFDLQPHFDVHFLPTPGKIGLQGFYPEMRTFGADAVYSGSWLAVKGEAAYNTSSNPAADDYLLYVVQLEKQKGELWLMAGYAGLVVTEYRHAFGFFPERGMARAFLLHGTYELSATRRLEITGALRQNAAGGGGQLEFSQSFGQHWRATVRAAAGIGGDPKDFLGQYNHNSHLRLTLRYSF